MEHSISHVGEQLRHHSLHSWQLGVLLACYNLTLVIGVLLLVLVSLNTILWAYLLVVSPFLFTGFWLWFTQQILRYYKHVSIHDALMVAKVGSLPLVAVFLCTSIALGVAPSYAADTPQWWMTAAYYGTLFGFGSTVLELTVIVFGLRHRLHTRR